MQVVNFFDLMKNMEAIMDQCGENHDLTVITRQDDKVPIVMMSLDEYNSWEETFYLMKSPRNHQELLSSIENVKKGKVQARDLLES